MDAGWCLLCCFGVWYEGGELVYVTLGDISVVAMEVTSFFFSWISSLKALQLHLGRPYAYNV